mgnify:CR=1 FL=1|jgi:hypothetical protein|tara:strand:- start:4093 stop:4626 length:534 start_codon:yes stop_codon:yes gene_type:complete
MRLTKYLCTLILLITLTSCGGFKKVDQRKMPDGATAKARKNIEEGKGVSIAGITKGMRGGTNYEFSSSNPMWRASLEILDFLPMTTVDYSGGMIITDWYSDNSVAGTESIKITIRFLSNEVRADSLKVIVHKKTCTSNLQSCNVNLLDDTKIKQELHASIIRKAAQLKKESEQKKKK